jgi:hypothetical protein
VLFLANVIGEPPDGEKIGGTVELDAVVKAEALTRQDFVGNGPEARVGDNEFAQVFTREQSG